MILERINIERNRFGKDSGQYEGSASFSNKHGDVRIKLTPDHCQRIFEVCADSIIDVATDAATDLRAAVLEHAVSSKRIGQDET